MRHVRQMKLAEIGVVGQERLAAAQASVAAEGLAGEVAVRYLAGAGIARLSVKDAMLSAAAGAVDPATQVVIDPSLDGEAAASSYPWRYRGPSEVAAGALMALHILRGALQDPT